MVNVSSPVDDSDKLRRSLAGLTRKQVLVGIPEDKTPRKGGEISNAGLMYIHTHGSPLRHIPARPVIEPAIEASDNREIILNQLGAAARAAVNRNPGETQHALQAAGMAARNAAIRWFTDSRNGWPPNSERTVSEKGSERPLIDTGQLRRSITYVVNDK
jgi:hypothetical protein